MKKTIFVIAFVLGFANLTFSQTDLTQNGIIVARIDNNPNLELQENEHAYIVKSIVDDVYYLSIDVREMTTGLDVEYFVTQSPGHKTVGELLFTTNSPGHKTVGEITLKY